MRWVSIIHIIFTCLHYLFTIFRPRRYIVSSSAGLLCISVGLIIVAIDCVYPHKFSTILEVDFDTPYDRHIIIEDSIHRKKRVGNKSLEEPEGLGRRILRLSNAIPYYYNIYIVKETRRMILSRMRFYYIIIINAPSFFLAGDCRPRKTTTSTTTWNAQVRTTVVSSWTRPRQIRRGGSRTTGPRPREWSSTELYRRTRWLAKRPTWQSLSTTATRAGCPY